MDSFLIQKLSQTGLTGLSGYFFVIINFRKKLMIRQSTFGGIKNVMVANMALSEFLPENSGHHTVILSYVAEGNWVFFVSSGNRE
jgi:hypothetical protein